MLLYQSAFLALLLFRVFQSFFSGFLALSPSYFYQVFRCLKFCCSIFKDRVPRPSPGLSLSGRAFLFYYLGRCLSSVFSKIFGYFFAFGKENRFHGRGSAGFVERERRPRRPETGKPKCPAGKPAEHPSDRMTDRKISRSI